MDTLACHQLAEVFLWKSWAQVVGNCGAFGSPGCLHGAPEPFRAWHLEVGDKLVYKMA